MLAVVLLIALLKPPYPHTSASGINKQDVRQVAAEKPKEAVQLPTTAPVQTQPEVKAVEPPSYPIGCENYVAEASKYNWNVTIAVNIMRAESGCNPYSVGDNRVINGLYAPSCGLMQIRTLQGRPSCEQLKDPATNIQWAYKLYSNRGNWNDWSVCKNGAARCY